MKSIDFKEACVSIHKRVKKEDKSENVYHRRAIRRNLYAIKALSRKLIKKEMDVLSGSQVWLLDNYYLIESEAKAVLRRTNKFSVVVGETIRHILEVTDNQLTPEMIEDVYATAKKLNIWREFDYKYAKSTCICVLIHSIRQAMYSDSNAIPALISSLRKIATFDFSALIEKYSPLDEIFNQEPTGFYQLCDDNTREEYKRCLEIQAKKQKVSETTLLSEYLKRANAEYKKNPNEKRSFIGYYLTEKTSHKGYFYILFSLFFVFLFITFWRFFHFTNMFLAVFLTMILVVPIFEANRLLIDYIYSLLIKNRPLPRLKLKTIPKEYKTLTVISALFTDEKDVGSLFSRLEEICLKNTTDEQDQTAFGLLVDFCESDEPVCPSDRVIFEAAKERIADLNQKYANRFHLFLRERTYCETSGKFLGYERKRGALCELCDFLYHRPTSFSYYCGHRENLDRVRYILTLDSDTNLGIGQLNELVGIIAHPQNRAQIEEVNGVYIVTDGYGVLQPAMKATLKSASKSRFASLICGSAGQDVYSFAGFDTFQTLFLRGVFCGKGIIDVEAFDLTVRNAFPDEKILSHDILEGTRLSCGLVTDVYLTDEQPSNVASFNKRAHRWVRGDVQSFPYVFSRVQNRYGKPINNPISLLNRYLLFNALRSWLLSPALIVCIITSLFLPRFAAAQLLAIATIPLILPFALTLITSIINLKIQPIYRNYFSRVTSGFWQTFLMLFYRLCTLFTDGINILDGIIRSVYRMNISKKKLLDWKTASQTDRMFKSNSLAYYYVTMLGTVVAGVGLIFVSKLHILLCLGILWCFSPLICFLLSIETSGNTTLSKKHKNQLKRYMRDMWGYFRTSVSASTHNLPPDHVVLSPVERTVTRTSPTNIGLYLLSVLAAADLGLVSTDELKKRLEDTVSTIEKLPKFRGHLYNWYDLTDLSVLEPAYISTVDSGNFVCCLVALREGIREYNSSKVLMDDLIERIASIERSTDFTCLYKPERHLFSLGTRPNEKAEDICYDFYMSEARLTSYYTVSKQIVEKKHWKMLSRTMVQNSLYFGAASWSGTAFEYFMPSLFLPIPPNSFTSESLKFAFSQQRRHAATLPDRHTVYGVSESGFFSLDGNLGYGYKANGIPTLSVRREEDDLIVSPYSSFLMLPIGGKSIMHNLEKMKNAGMYGRFGFIEAIDFTPGRSENECAPVPVYMAHHIGMSMIAAANAVHGNVFVRRFMTDKQMGCGYELLEEQIPVDAIVHKNIKEKGIDSKIRRKIQNSALHESVPDLENPIVHLKAGKDLSLLLADNGQAKLLYRTEKGVYAINRPPIHPTDLPSGIIPFVLLEGEMLSTSPAFNLSPAEITFLSNGEKGIFHVKHSKGRFECESYLLASAAAYVSEITVRRKQAYCGFFLEPILENEWVYYAHPAFHSLFLHTRVLREENAVLFYKRGEGERDICIAATLIEQTKTSKQPHYTVGRRLTFNCTQGYERCESGMDANERIQNTLQQNDFDCTEDGTVLSPLLLLKTRRPVEKATLIIAPGKSCDEALENLKRARNILQQQKQFEHEVSWMREYNPNDPTVYPYARLFNRLGFYGCDVRSLEPRAEMKKQEDFWRFGISGDYPIVAIELSGDENGRLGVQTKGRILDLLRGYKANISFTHSVDLVFLNDSGEFYDDGVFSTLNGLIRKSGCEHFLHTKPGIHLLRTMDDTSKSLIMQNAAIFLNETTLSPLPKFDPISYRDITINRQYPTPFGKDHCLYPLRCGCFTVDGFHLDKSRYVPPRPYSHILSNGSFSTLITDRSLGYTWEVNARENRLTFWQNNPYSDLFSEKILLIDEDQTLDLLSFADSVFFSANFARYEGRIPEGSFLVEVTVKADQPTKCVKVTLSRPKGKLMYRLLPVMGERPRKVGKVCIGTSDSQCDISFGYTITPSLYIHTNRPIEYAYDGFLTVSVDGENSTEFYLSSLAERPDKPFDKILEDATGFVNQYLPNHRKHGCPTEIFTHFWLPYQTIMCRIFARSGFYQSSGAFGFRDQLQDAMCIRDIVPALTKKIILEAASHQFSEGDCLHWWHPSTSSDSWRGGARTRCSDDYLFLIFALSAYLQETNDKTILTELIPFAEGDVLKDGEREKYIRFSLSERRATLFEHATLCMRLLLSRGLGSHGFPLMGSCDWNDGMSAIGENGGESVWLGWFARMNIRAYLRDIGCVDGALKEQLLSFYQSLSSALERSFNGRWYPRAYFASGECVGNDTTLQNSACCIDILPQAFAVFDYCDNPHKDENEKDRAILAIESAYEILFDESKHIIRLFTPPFSNEKPSPGYISRYEKGLRENGGQYTHAAVWLARAFLMMGKECQREDLTEKGKKMIRAILPIRYALNKELADRYGGEPYVLAGDIYANPDYNGRCGWSWYTGAAGWLYRTMKDFDLGNMDFI